jgi:2-desacetyl-2-hydroxyethyl bacteriochlorophyllide A dehydrogenase
MKASAVVVTAVDTVELQTLDLPDPSDGEVLVASLYSCISPGTEVRCLAGKQPEATFPFVPGYALAGTTIAEGTTVFCMGSEYTGSVTRAWGAHMSHAICPEAGLMTIPEGVDLVQASAVKMASIPYHGVRLCAPLPEEKVAVIGLGAIGHMAAKLYTATGAHVVACDTVPARVEAARKAGVTAEVVKGTLKDTFAPHFPDGADAVVDCTGVPAVFAQSLAVCRELPWGDHLTPGPRFVVQGSYPATVEVPYAEAFVRELSMVFPRSDQDRDKVILFDMIRRGAISMDSVITAVREPEQAQETYSQLKDPDSGVMTVVFSWK